MNISQDLILSEVISRSRRMFRLEDFCFPEQLNFIRDPARFKTAVCSRRSGKTVGCAADLIFQALLAPERVCLYITLARNNAKKLIWPELLKINELFQLGGHPDNTELSLTFPNKSVVYCSGAKDKSEIEKFRGLAITLCYIDEAQSFRPHIEELIDDVVSKALFDYNGKLCVIGTPGPVQAGYFHKIVHSPKWIHHTWTMFDNPHLERKSGKKPMQLVIEDMDRMGVTIDHPKIQRECFGRWVVDTDSLVFKYDAERNHYDALPVPKHGGWNYILGVDVGHDDADAIAVIAWHEHFKEAFLVEELIANRQGVTELADAISSLINKYNAHRVVMDTGGLGKKIAVELQRRFALPIIAAEKQRKFEYIELLNDSLRTKKFMAKRDSAFAQDCQLIEWDIDKEHPEKLKVSDAYHSDIADAVLYGWREALHWLYQPEEKKPEPNTPEWFKEQEDEYVKQLEQELQNEKNLDVWENSVSGW